MFTVAGTPENSVALYDDLAKMGFRRSHQMLYRPHCPSCNACQSARIRVQDFKISRSQRRIRNRNRHLRRIVAFPQADNQQYALFRKYLEARHQGGSMCNFDYDSYVSMVEDTSVTSRLVIYVNDESNDSAKSQLVAVALTDVLEDGLSMVYSFFDPDTPRNSIGTHIILDHVEFAAELALDYVYLGFWVPGSGKMNYKARFSPLEVYGNGTWERLRQSASESNSSHVLERTEDELN